MCKDSKGSQIKAGDRLKVDKGQTVFFATYTGRQTLGLLLLDHHGMPAVASCEMVTLIPNLRQ